MIPAAWAGREPSVHTELEQPERTALHGLSLDLRAILGEWMQGMDVPGVRTDRFPKPAAQVASMGLQGRDQWGKDLKAHGHLLQHSAHARAESKDINIWEFELWSHGRHGCTRSGPE